MDQMVHVLYFCGNEIKCMEWINKNDQMPPEGKFEDESIYVLVTDGTMIGHGSYCYDRKKWHYNMPGYIEQDNNKVTHWMMFPSLPND
jgi:hypothetical protein